MFQHDKLVVYQRAQQFQALADRLAADLPRGRAYLVDQLRRAANSIVNNIAEGAGEFSPLDKGRFYRFALRSATESASLVQQCVALGLSTEERGAEALRVVDEVVAMLTALSRRFAVRGEGEG
jgi:four helix bundle protein